MISDCVFENNEQLISSLERAMNRTLPVEQRMSITNAAQHLPPPPWPEVAILIVLGGLLLLLLGWEILATLVLLFVAKSATIFGLDEMNNLLGRFIQQREPGKEAVGALEQFRQPTPRRPR